MFCRNGKEQGAVSQLTAHVAPFADVLQEWEGTRSSEPVDGSCSTFCKFYAEVGRKKD